LRKGIFAHLEQLNEFGPSTLHCIKWKEKKAIYEADVLTKPTGNCPPVGGTGGAKLGGGRCPKPRRVYCLYGDKAAAISQNNSDWKETRAVGKKH